MQGPKSRAPDVLARSPSGRHRPCRTEAGAAIRRLEAPADPARGGYRRGAEAAAPPQQLAASPRHCCIPSRQEPPLAWINFNSKGSTDPVARSTVPSGVVRVNWSQPE